MNALAVCLIIVSFVMMLILGLFIGFVAGANVQDIYRELQEYKRKEKDKQ